MRSYISRATCYQNIFNHFINLKCVDFFYGKALEKLQDHEKKVIDNTIDRYWSVIKENTNSLQRDDLKIVALETAWEATEKYIQVEKNGMLKVGLKITL